MAVTVDDHRWSGWPGAWCVDCGQADPMETCLSVHDLANFVCRVCRQSWPQGKCYGGKEHDVESIPCPDHPLTKCPTPGANKEYK